MRLGGVFCSLVLLTVVALTSRAGSAHATPVTGNLVVTSGHAQPGFSSCSIFMIATDLAGAGYLVRASEEGIRQELGQEILAVKRPTFSYDRDFTLSAFGRQFDFLLAQSVFSHSAPRQVRRCLAEARAVMTPTAIFIATYWRGRESYTGEECVYPGRVRYTAGDMAALAREQGLVCQTLDWAHPSGQTWIAITHPAHRDQVRPVTNRCSMVAIKHWLRHRGAATLGLARRLYRRPRTGRTPAESS